MSKSYGKYKKVGICDGSNTEYYRNRRKHQRHVNNNRIRNILSKHEINDFDDNYVEFTIPKTDSWDEPTDGTYILNAKEINKLKKEDGAKYPLYTTKNNKVKK